MNNLSKVFDGKNYIGENISDVVYLWTRNNIPCYIGITDNPIHDRIYHHFTNTDHRLFQRKLRKYKTEFECYILEQNNDYNKLKELETMYIKQYDTYAYDNPKYGYNLTLGGDGCKGYRHTDEHKKIMKNLKIGKKLSEEHRYKIGKSLIGRKHSQETKEILRMKKLGKKQSKEHIINRANSRKVSDLIKWLEKEAPWFCKVEQLNNEVTY